MCVGLLVKRQLQIFNRGWCEHQQAPWESSTCSTLVHFIVHCQQGTRAFPAGLCHPTLSAALQGLTQNCNFQLCLWIAFLEGIYPLLMQVISK